MIMDILKNLFLLIFFTLVCIGISLKARANCLLAEGGYKMHSNVEDAQVAVVRQLVWENLNRVPGTSKDFESVVRLRIANGNIIDRDCKLIFPESSWEIASLVLNDYKEVVKKTNLNIFEVIYRLMVDENIRATEIVFSGLWRPWRGSHAHLVGRGIDIRSIRGEAGSGVIFNLNTSGAENSFGKIVRESLTTNFPRINQYLCPWFICNPVGSSCTVNTGVSKVEKDHRDHLHLTLNP